MKSLHIFTVAGMFALLGIFNFVAADIRNDSASQSLTYTIDAGDGSVAMPDVSFDGIGNGAAEISQATCAMTPGGSAPSLLLQEPETIPNRPYEWTEESPEVAYQPISSLDSPLPTRRPLRRPNEDSEVPTIAVDVQNPSPDNPENDTTSVVPEPATLLIVGFGIGVASYVSRRKRNPR